MTEPPIRRDAPGREAGGVLVVGYGNALRSDDGVGVHAAGMLARDPRLARADVRAVMQLTPELAADIARVALVVLIDASTEVAAGEVRVRRLPAQDGRPGESEAPSASSHHVGPTQLVTLASILYGAAPEVVVVSVGVATMEVGEGLSPAVAAALPDVADAVAAVVARL